MWQIKFQPFIKVLECQKGMRDPGIVGCYTPSVIKEQYLENQKAAVYVVSDYFFENYGPSPDPVKLLNYIWINLSSHFPIFCIFV